MFFIRNNEHGRDFFLLPAEAPSSLHRINTNCQVAGISNPIEFPWNYPGMKPSITTTEIIFVGETQSTTGKLVEAVGLYDRKNARCSARQLPEGRWFQALPIDQQIFVLGDVDGEAAILQMERSTGKTSIHMLHVSGYAFRGALLSETLYVAIATEDLKSRVGKFDLQSFKFNSIEFPGLDLSKYWPEDVQAATGNILLKFREGYVLYSPISSSYEVYTSRGASKITMQPNASIFRFDGLQLYEGLPDGDDQFLLASSKINEKFDVVDVIPMSQSAERPEPSDIVVTESGQLVSLSIEKINGSLQYVVKTKVKDSPPVTLAIIPDPWNL